MTWEYRGLEEVTGGYKGLQGVTRGYRGLQGVTGGDKGLQRIIETFSQLERSHILFLGLFCIKIKVKEISNFLTNTMDQNIWKNYNFAFFINSCFYSL